MSNFDGMEEKRIEGLWDCVFCGSKRIRARFDTCPNCGKSRGIDTIFYMPKETASSVLTEEQAKKTTNRPDWLCKYCDSYNRSDASFCKKCGAPRSHAEDDYGTLHNNKEWRRV